MNTLTPASKLTARLPFSRNALIAASVVVLHVGFIWGLQSGLLMRAAELVVPVELLSQIIEPPAPKPDTPRDAETEIPLQPCQTERQRQD